MGGYGQIGDQRDSKGFYRGKQLHAICQGYVSRARLTLTILYILLTAGLVKVVFELTTMLGVNVWFTTLLVHEDTIHFTQMSFPLIKYSVYLRAIL